MQSKISTVKSLSKKIGYQALIGGIDSDAQIYVLNVIANGGTVSSTTAAAINILCKELKANGLWDKMYEIYPVSGTGLSAALTKLKYASSSLMTNVNFVEGDYTETGASGGLIGNGTTKYAQTGVPLNNGFMTTNDASIGVYHTVINTSAFSVDLGTRTQNNYTGTTSTSGNDSIGFNVQLTAPSAGLGLSFGQCEAGGTIRIYRAGVSIATNTGGSYNGSGASHEHYLLAANNLGTAQLYSINRIAFGFLAKSFTSGEASALNTVVQTFQTALGRNK